MKSSNLTVGTKLAAGFTVVLVLLISIVGIAWWRLDSVNQVLATMMDEVLVKERLASEWATRTNVNGARTALVAESLDATRQQQVQALIKQNSERISAIQKQLEAFDNSEEEDALFDQIAAQRKLYIAARENVFKEKAVSEESARLLVAQKLEPALNDYVAMIDKMAAYHAAHTAQMAREIERAGSWSQRLTALLGVLAVLLGATVAWLITRSIKKQLGGEPAYAVAIANSIAGGDLSNDIAIARGDRKSLLFAMNSMQERLARAITQVRHGTETIASASTQIATGNQDLSERTERQASALEETASSMEELTSTVRHNADNARQANGLATSASEVAGKGGMVVSQVVETMSSITESSKKIADITGVIDGLAFQTNILALNAAVEAARAGEQGKGFAVVAGEVRTLAQRSAAAAKEIRVLIQDSVEKVDTGSRLVDEAGETMQQIVDSIRRVRGIINDIAEASSEQTAGIEQINQAITQMDGVTQQNAALVEEAAAAADAMQQQAATLAQAVALFKLEGSQLDEVPLTLPSARGKLVTPSPLRHEQPARIAASPMPQTPTRKRSNPLYLE